MGKSESQRFAEFIEWIWSKREADRSFHVDVVTSTGTRVSELPQPPLSRNEAEVLFRFLEDQKLVTFHKEVESRPGKTYFLNIVEQYRWSALIRELKKPDWQRSWVYTKVRDCFFWIITLIIAAILGASGEPVFNAIARKFNWIEEPAATASPVVGHEPDVLKQEGKPDDAKK
jgi:hypothetical protein